MKKITTILMVVVITMNACTKSNSGSSNNTNTTTYDSTNYRSVTTNFTVLSNPVRTDDGQYVNGDNIIQALANGGTWSYEDGSWHTPAFQSYYVFTVNNCYNINHSNTSNGSIEVRFLEKPKINKNYTIKSQLNAIASSLDSTQVYMQYYGPSSGQVQGGNLSVKFNVVNLGYAKQNVVTISFNNLAYGNYDSRNSWTTAGTISGNISGYTQ